MTFEAPGGGARDLIGPGSTPELMDRALRFCGGIGPDGEPGAHGLVGKATTAEHFCQLEAEAFLFCSRAGAGGVAPCVVCGIPIFVPPSTCFDRVEPEISATFHFSDLRRS